MTARRPLFDDEESPVIARRPTKKAPATLDDLALIRIEDVEALSSARLVPFYLMASFAYYELNATFMEDAAYDRICVRLREEWQQVVHPHKRLIKFDSLSATTGYALKFHKLPLIVRVSTHRLLDLSREGTLLEYIRPPQRRRVTIL